MRRLRLVPRREVIIALTAAALAASGCGGSAAGGATSTAPSSGTGSAKARSHTTGRAALAAAQQAIAPYVGHPSPFPATQALAKRPPPGSKFVFLQCSAPVCAIFAHLLGAPAHELGVNLVTINSGSSATSAQSAAASALADKPAAVLVSATAPQLYGGYLHKLIAAGSVVAGGGTVGGKPYGVQQAVGGERGDNLAGKLMADWVVVHKKLKANVVFFGTPQLTFSKGMQAAFAKELSRRCPGCKASYQQLSITTYGSTAPSQVVSYLQSHPKVNTVVFASMEGATGLAAALRDAHISPTTLGFAPTPSNLQDIASGGLTAGLGLDFNVQVWMQVNLAARLMAHQHTAQSNLQVDMQFLTKSDLTGKNLSQGWTGYPNVAQRMAKLWGLAG